MHVTQHPRRQDSLDGVLFRGLRRVRRGTAQRAPARLPGAPPATFCWFVSGGPQRGAPAPASSLPVDLALQWCLVGRCHWLVPSLASTLSHPLPAPAAWSPDHTRSSCLCRVPFRKLPGSRERHTQPRRKKLNYLFGRERKRACEPRGKIEPESSGSSGLPGVERGHPYCRPFRRARGQPGPGPPAWVARSTPGCSPEIIQPLVNGWAHRGGRRGM